MSTLGKTQIAYSDAFAALGRFVSQQDLSDVCVMEFDGGVIVTGSKMYATGESLRRHIATHVLSNEDVLRLIKGGKDATPHT